jgi:hypothetical protein
MEYSNMKKIITLIILIIILGSCATTPQEKIRRFTVDINSHEIPIGEVELQIDKMFFGGIKKINAEVFYYPFEDAVCLKYKTDIFIYYQFWSVAGRNLFVSSLDIYNEDYTDRNLNPSDRKTKNLYGTIEGYLYWQQSSISRRFYANMDIELGYFFRERAPFFTVTQKLTTYIDRASKERNSTSQEVSMYFTRAQAAQLAGLFSQELLKEHTPEELYLREISRDTSTEFDVY